MRTLPLRLRAGPLYFSLVCVIYMVGSTYVDAASFVYLSALSILLGLAMGLVCGNQSRTGSTATVMIVTAVLAAINVLVSENRTETLMRWGLWLTMVGAVGMLATYFDEMVDRSLTALLPFGFLMVWVAKYTLGFGEDILQFERVGALHTSAFFAGLMAICGLFHPLVPLRWFFVLLGTYGVLVSGSRAAFILFPLLFLPPCLYYFRSRFMGAIALSVPLLLVATLFLNENFRDATFGLKSRGVGRDVIEDAQRSLDDRGALREIAVEMMLQKPLGYGYGNTYNIPGANKSRGTNFHNGYMNVAVPLGLHFLILYVIFNAWLVWSLLVDSRVSRLFRYFFLSILIAANLRAATEDFTLFDLGNPVCYLIIYMYFLYLNKRRYIPSVHPA